MSVEFYKFRSRLVSTTFTASPTEQKIDHIKLIKGNYVGIKFPVVFKQSDGNKLTDILDTGLAGLYLISDRLKRLLEEACLTGWKIYPVIVFDKKNNEVPGYNGFSIKGHCSDINYKKSEIIEKTRVPNGPICQFYKGIYIDNWDGSDFFSPQTTLNIFVTKNAANILKNNKITNLELENLSNYEVNVKSVNTK